MTNTILVCIYLYVECKGRKQKMPSIATSGTVQVARHTTTTTGATAATLRKEVLQALRSSVARHTLSADHTDGYRAFLKCPELLPALPVN